MTMTKNELVARLLSLPDEIETAQVDVLAMHQQVLEAKDLLQEKEDSLLLHNKLDGKNAETRAAQARQFTGHERELLSGCELQLKNTVSRLERLQIQFKAYRAVAGLIQVTP
ncbi:hypothetical protein [Paenibacillus daejeonensis]|uniref:hypothetical protein n=1 Tax=Paenibacillus daejeonensis TaxID=135193 RepID=UPI0003828366|nr:hypothetical protein [Paenibacillus daejeonensis]